MSKTPRTDAEDVIDGNETSGYSHVVDADFARQLELELNAANARINALEAYAERLDTAGTRVMNAWLMPEDSMEYCDLVDLCRDAKLAWHAAKETKP